MSAQHTPGPWTTDGSARGGDLDIIAPSGRVALIDCDPRGDVQSEALLESNARLIAAAPVMRKTLELALLALNVAPRFLVPGAPEGLQDSYRICAEIERVLRTSSGVQS